MQSLPTWSVVVPVKRLDVAKSRLGDDRQSRAELAMAFALDCVTALLAARSVARVIVVSADEALRPIMRARGADWLDETDAHGLNGAAMQALTTVDGPAAVVVGDLPSLTPAAVDLVAELARAVPRGFISDAEGTGTTMLLARDRADCVPAFGARSRARHRSAGFVDLGLDATLDRMRALDLARARRDVDTDVDLADAIRLGVGDATARILQSG